MKHTNNKKLNLLNESNTNNTDKLSENSIPIDTKSTTATVQDIDNHINDKNLHIADAERIKWNTIDNSLSTISINCVQNKVISEKIISIESRNMDFANDLEELSGYIINLHKYSSDEQMIGTWIDGKTLYHKTIRGGTLPNNTIKDVATDIDNPVTMINMYGIALSLDFFIQLPCSHPQSKYAVELSYVRSTNKVRLSTNYDRTPYSESYITLEYTK